MPYRSLTILFFLSTALCLLLLLTPKPAETEEFVETVAFTSLEWPPYTGTALAGGGASTVIAREAFAAVGVKLEVTYLPWSRAIMTAKRDKNFAGYLPEYYAKEIEEDFFFSEPMGTSPLGFVEHKDFPVQWKTLEDLKGMPIGVVKDYVNTERFDALAAQGVLDVKPVNDDATNVRKVQSGRIPLAVIDVNVLKYLRATDPLIAERSESVHVNERLLEKKALYICFRKDSEGRRLLKLFNEGLSRIDWQAMEADYMAKALD